MHNTPVINFPKGYFYMILFWKKRSKPTKAKSDITPICELITELDFITDFDLITNFWRFT